MGNEDDFGVGVIAPVQAVVCPQDFVDEITQFKCCTFVTEGYANSVRINDISSLANQGDRIHKSACVIRSRIDGAGGVIKGDGGHSCFLP